MGKLLSTLGYYISIPFAWLMRLFYGLTGSFVLTLVLVNLTVSLASRLVWRLAAWSQKKRKTDVRKQRETEKIRELKREERPSKGYFLLFLLLISGKEVQIFTVLFAILALIVALGVCLTSVGSFMPYYLITRPLSGFMMLSGETVEQIRAFASGLGYAAESAGGGILTAPIFEEMRLAQFVGSHFSDFSGFDGLIRMDYGFLGLDLTVIPAAVWRQALAGSWPALGLLLLQIVRLALVICLTALKRKANASDRSKTATVNWRLIETLLTVIGLLIWFLLPAAFCVYAMVSILIGIVRYAILCARKEAGAVP